MTPEDIVRLQAFREHEPWPWQQMLHMMAKLAEIIAGTVEDRRGRHVLYANASGKRMAAADFIPDWWKETENLALGRPANYRPPPRQQSPEEVMSLLGFLDHVAS